VSCLFSFKIRVTVIALTRPISKGIAYQLERKLFDNSHATTVLETQNTLLILDIKNAGLICLCVNYSTDLADISFDTDKQSIDDIYSALKEQKVICKNPDLIRHF
jgi:bifunctional enzyme CysN/CysC